MKRSIAMSSVLLLTACANQVDGGRQAEATGHEDYRISVEIPLQNMQIEEDAILKVDELLSERTHFKASDFHLDEVVLVGRGEGGEGNAELLVLEWRSGRFAVPEGEADEWYEVRIPAPSEDLQGAWLLDITGAVTVDFLVAVLEPRPPVVEVAKTTTRRSAVYSSAPTVHHTHWIYEPSRYYIYHYHDVWRYRYFIGPWSYRYYDLGYRPYRFHYGPLFRPYRLYRSRSYGQWRNRGYGDEAAPRRATAAAPRRIDPQLVKLRRSHPRLRTFDDDASRPRRGEGDRVERSSRQQRYEEAKRSHPRLRAFHRQENRQSGRRRSESAETNAETNMGTLPSRRRVSEAREPRDADLGRLSNRRGVNARPSESPAASVRRPTGEARARSQAPSSRVRALRGGRTERRAVSAAPTSRPNPTSQSRPSFNRRSATAQQPAHDARAPVMRSPRTRSAAPPTPRRQAPVERHAVRPASNVRTRSFQRQPRATATPRRETSRSATPRRPHGEAMPSREAAPRRAAPARSAPPARDARRSNSSSQRFERR